MNAEREQRERLDILLALFYTSDDGVDPTVDELAERSGYDAARVSAAFLWLREHRLVCSGRSNGAERFHPTPLGKMLLDRVSRRA